jgi:hypothetical protein
LFDARFRRVALALGAALLYPGKALAQSPPPPPPPTEAAPGTAAQDVASLRDEVKALRADLDEVRAAQSAGSSPAAATPRPLGYESFWPWVVPPEGLSLKGYLQSQYETHQDSQDQLTQAGTTLNQDRFSIRRARVSLTGEWQYAALALELDANTTSGPQVDLRKAEASLQYRPDR